MTTNTTKPKVKAKAKKKAAPKPRAKSGIAPENGLGDNTNNSPAAKVKPEDVKNGAIASGPRPAVRRVPMHGAVDDNIPHEARDPNFHFRWCADYDKGKIERYKGALWEFVLRDGEKIKRPGGEPLYLMKLPIEYREQDLLAKRGKITDINREMQNNSKVDKKSAVPDYLPDGQDSVTERDDL
jgi:hypothetical protein